MFDLPTDQAERRCRVCGCTDLDCRRCIAKTGEPCRWVEPDLCSACARDGQVARAREGISVKRLAWIPIVGIAVEVCRGGGYLSDSDHPNRFVLSSLWHALWLFALFRTLVYWLGS